MRINQLLAQDVPAEFKRQHTARWFAYSGAYGELERYDGRRLFGIGFEIECKCGAWKSRTGGAIKASVKDDHAGHILDEYYDSVN